MTLLLASDHAGLILRQHVVAHLQSAGHAITDLGCFGAEKVDYPGYAATLGRRLAAGEARLGILICGTGLGMSMAANRIAGVRAALCTDPYTAQLARSHNDANVLCLGQRVLGQGLAVAIVEAFVAASFAGGRHSLRLAQLKALEARP